MRLMRRFSGHNFDVLATRGPRKQFIDVAAWPLTIPVSVSQQASGSTSFSVQVSTTEAMMARCSAPWSEPANSAFFQSAVGQIKRSTALFSIAMRSSSVKRVRPFRPASAPFRLA